MTFEERLDEIAKGLKQFTNGLNHVIELQARNEIKIDRLGEAQVRNEALMERLAEAQSRNELLQSRNETLQSKNELLMSRVLEALAQDGENIRGLAAISATHERRLTRLESPGA